MRRVNVSKRVRVPYKEGEETKFKWENQFNYSADFHEWGAEMDAGEAWVVAIVEQEDGTVKCPQAELVQFIKGEGW